MYKKEELVNFLCEIVRYGRIVLRSCDNMIYDHYTKANSILHGLNILIRICLNSENNLFHCLFVK